MQKYYIKILNTIYVRYLSNIDWKVRQTYVRCIFIFFSVYFILFYSSSFYGEILYTNNQRQTFAGLLLVFSALFCIKEPLKLVRWKKSLAIFYWVCAAGLVITGLMHPTGDGYLNFGFMLFTVYPCFFIVWNNRKDYETLFDIIASSNLIVNMIYSVYCLCLFVIDPSQFSAVRFRGTAWNANLFSFIGMSLFCSAIYLLYRRRYAHSVRKLCYLGSVATGATIVILGQSRNAVLVIVLSTIAYGLFRLKTVVLNGLNNKKALCVCGAVILCTMCMITIIHFTTDNNTVSQSDTGTGVIERFSLEGKDLDSFSSGRVHLWNIYIPMLNMLGNNVEEIDWEELPVTEDAHCHNNFLEYGYRCGIPVALAFTILELVAGIISLWYLFDRYCKRSACLFSVIVMIMYAINSVVDIATLPMERHAPFFFYLMLTFMIDAEPLNNIKREKNN